jgi:BMFP domain-containing protein YqiC
MSGANLSPSNQSQDPATNVVQAAVSMLEIQRLERELQQAKTALQAQMNDVDVWKRQAFDAHTREKHIERQRDEAMNRIMKLQNDADNGVMKQYQGLRNEAELKNLSLQQLQQLKQILRSDLDHVDQVLSVKTQPNA